MGELLKNPAFVTAAVLAAVIVVSALLIVRENRARREATIKSLQKSFGKPGNRKLISEKLASIGAYARGMEEKDGGDAAKGRETFFVDDITWHDLALDDVFSRIGGTVSDPGDAVLYDWLRRPLLSGEKRAARARRISLFGENATLRQKVQLALSEAGRLKKLSYFEAMHSLREAKPVGAGKFAALGLLTLASIVLFFFQPLIAIFVFLGLAVVNLAVYLSMKEKTGAQVTAFGCVLRLLGCGRALKDLGLSELPEEMAELSRLLEKLKSFRFGSAFVMAGAQVNTGIGNTLLQYVNMFFHLDLIRFDRMLSAVQGEEDTLTDLLRVLGSLDAAAAVASFRASLPTWTEGEITENGAASNAWMRAEGLVHPLLAKPVPNDVSANGGNLLTGSNASGKSTFLKSVALAAILGQGLATVPANAYRAPFFRVLTSMALSDNLQGGESYFIVEIRSLKRILDAANTSGAPVLGIVDEVLRGTNTIERIAASAEILETLVQPNVLAFAATHDIELSYILEDDFTNLHFEEQFDGSDVVFDYKLREGRATSRNAIRLLSAAGYDPEITHRAESMAADFEKTGRWARTTD